ncbi:MAG: nucleotidyltransferase domain-containing protein [Candidatus Omnitrophica bacterium]|nr:nucleotidyltransferase domain-containing protein [Candidatus Omnitrophota bacterium]
MSSNVRAIILYGSHSRKDNDAKSDVDVCVFVDRLEQKVDMSFLGNLTGESFAKDTNFVSYSTATLSLMIANGSLFLWHLKNESKILYGKSYFDKTIKNLRPFKGHASEIKFHHELLDDLIASWKYVCIPNEFDLALLFTIARNTCMVLCHKKGLFCFGRMSSFNNAKNLFPDMPLEVDCYSYLSGWKMIYERGDLEEKKIPNMIRYKNLVACLKGLLEYAKKKTD